jgi:hypothetical protein
MEGPPDLELIVNRFNRLVKEILQGEVKRTCFQPWEVELLIDLQECGLTRSRRYETLRRYQRAVQHQLERSGVPPLRFAEFVRRARKPSMPSMESLSAQDAAPLHS